MIPETINTIVIYNLASYVVGELTEVLYAILKEQTSYQIEVGVQVQGDQPQWELNSTNILYLVVCPSGLNLEIPLKYPKYYIPYQLEPPYKFKKYPLYYQIIKNGLQVWDFSTKNCSSEWYHNLNVKYVPIGYHPSISASDMLYSDNYKDIDVLFLGTYSIPRRMEIKTQLLKRGLSVQFIFGLNLIGMRSLIRRSKICIDIKHSELVQNLPTIRLNILLSNQACIVAEKVSDIEGMDEYSKCEVDFVEHSQITERCCQLLTNFELRKNKALNGYHHYKTNYLWSKIVDFKKLLE